MMRGFAEALADERVGVLLPYYFDKTGTEPGAAALQTMFGHMAAWQEALADAARFCGGRVALVGFSLGGHLSLRLRAAVPVVATISAPSLTGLGPATNRGVPHVQIHHGEADRLVDVGNAGLIAEMLSSEGVVAEVHLYSEAGHGFSGARPGDAAALRLSRERTVEFVSAHL
jgi:dienelactone hydrolase